MDWMGGWDGVWVGELGGERMLSSCIPHGFVVSVDFVVRST